MPKLHLVIYSKRDCSLCVPFKDVVHRVAKQSPWQDQIAVEDIDIEKNPEAFALYHEKIPVLTINGRLAFKYFVTEEDLLESLTKQSQFTPL
jgi:glutaredoxin